MEIDADVDRKFCDLLSTKEEEDLTVDERIKKRLNAYLDQQGEKKCSDDEFQKAKQIDEGSSPCKQNRTPSSAGVPSSPPVQEDDASPLLEDDASNDGSLRCPRGHQLSYKPASDARGKGKCDCCGQLVAIDDSIGFCVLLSE